MLHGKNEGIQLLRAVLFLGIIAFHSNVPYTQMLWGRPSENLKVNFESGGNTS